MATGKQIQKKGSSHFTPTPATGMFKPRPFAEPVQPEAATPEVQTKVELGNIGGDRLAGMQVSAPAPIQAKLTIGAPGDKYEQEADTIAETVMKMPAISAPAPVENPTPQSSVAQAKPISAAIFAQAKPISAAITPVEPVIQMQPQPSESLSEEAGENKKGFIQRRIKVQAAADGSLHAPNSLETQISQSKNSGSPLAPQIRAYMEPRFGADFSSVRVHTDSQAVQMNRDLSAQAFTHGNHIYYGSGKSPGNDHLTAHELTHTIQQGTSSIQTKKESIGLSSLVNSTMLQMKSVIVNDKAHTRKLSLALTGTPAEKMKAVEKGSQGQQYNKGDIIEISDTETEHIKDESHVFAWYRTQGSNPPEYIRGSKIFNVGVLQPNQNIEDPEGDNLLESFNEGVIGTTGDSIEEYSDSLKENNKNANTTDLDIAQGSFGIAGGIFSMAISIRDLVKNQQRGFSDWISTIWESLTGISNITSGISQIVSSANDSKKAESVSDWSGSIGSAMSTLAGGIKTIKAVANLIEMIASDEKYDRDEYIKKTSEIIGGALETAKGVVETIKDFLDIFNTATAGLGTAIPAIGIAISATQTIVQGYYLSVSAYQWSKMRKQSQIIANEVNQKISQNTPESKAEKIREKHRKDNAEISNYQSRLSEKTAKNLTREQLIQSHKQIKQSYIDQKNALESEKQQLQQEKQQLEQEKQSNNPAPTPERKKTINNQLEEIQAKLTGKSRSFDSGIKGKLEKLQKKITDQNTEIQKLETAKSITDRKIDDARSKISIIQGESHNSLMAHGLSPVDIEELDLAEELRSGNRKRVVRQAIHIAANATKIAGNIATLSGAGAIAGITLQASAAGVETSLPFFRALKQYGRNIAANNKAKGESGISNWIFDSDKSTKAKLDARKKNVVTIFNMVNSLNKFLPLPTDPVQKQEKQQKLTAQATRVENYIRASGCSPKALYRNNGKPAEQAKMLLQALYQREF